MMIFESVPLRCQKCNALIAGNALYCAGCFGEVPKQRARPEKVKPDVGDFLTETFPSIKFTAAIEKDKA